MEQRHSRPLQDDVTSGCKRGLVPAEAGAETCLSNIQMIPIPTHLLGQATGKWALN